MSSGFRLFHSFDIILHIYSGERPSIFYNIAKSLLDMASKGEPLSRIVMVSAIYLLGYLATVDRISIETIH
jgi:hypothetical protein